MKTTDLKTGMAVKINGEIFCVIGNILINKKNTYNLKQFNEENFISLLDSDLRITGVYKSKDDVMENILNGINLEIIFKPKNIKITDIFEALELAQKGHKIKSLISNEIYVMDMNNPKCAAKQFDMTIQEITGEWEIELNEYIK